MSTSDNRDYVNCKSIIRAIYELSTGLEGAGPLGAHPVPLGFGSHLPLSPPAQKVFFMEIFPLSTSCFSQELKKEAHATR
jgi:hypothetical protein